MGDIGAAVIAAVASTIAAMLGLFGVVWKLRKERETKQIEGDASTEVAAIQAGSNERIHLVDTLMARVSALEEDSQAKEQIVINLTREAAISAAEHQLSEAEKKMLIRENAQLEHALKEQVEENKLLKRQLQEEVSEALATLDDVLADKDE